MTQTIDSPFITLLEQKNENVHFYRIDADLSDNFVDEALSEETAKDYTDKLTELFKKALDVENITIKVEALKNKDLSSMLTLSEESRRMQEMMKMYGMAGMGMDPAMFGGKGETLVLNAKTIWSNMSLTTRMARTLLPSAVSYMIWQSLPTDHYLPMP